MKLCEAIGCRIAELLEERNMTRYKLYKSCGLSKSCINNIANGQYESALTTNLWIICQGLGISLHDFLILLCSIMINRILDPSKIRPKLKTNIYNKEF